MSAYMVDNNHVAYLLHAAGEMERGNLSWYHAGRWTELNELNARDVGQMLVDENARSVAYRYSDTSFDDARFEYVHSLADCWEVVPVQVIKACHCLAYQSCEHPEWPGSSARALLDAIEASATRRLPGYAAAEWGAPERSGQVRLLFKRGGQS